MKKHLSKKKLQKLLDKVRSVGTRQYEAVHVQWRDARSVACGWTPVSEVKQDGAREPVIHTCGWLIQETKGYLLVGVSVDDLGHDMCDMVLKIPRENVASMKKLGKVKL